jgi:hypothetical protein
MERMRPPGFVNSRRLVENRINGRRLGTARPFPVWRLHSGPQSSSVDQYSETPPEHLASTVAEAVRRSVVTRHCLSKKWTPKWGVCPVLGVLLVVAPNMPSDIALIPVRAIDNASLSDLHHQPPVVTVFLNDSVAVAGGPEIVFVVDDAAVGGVRSCLPVAEAVHNLAIGIELNERWSLPGDFSLLVRHIVPIDDKHMILAVHADAAYLAGDPILGQRFWPSGIHFILERAALRLRSAKGYGQHNETEEQRDCF